MGNWHQYQLPPEATAGYFWSRRAATKAKLPRGHFEAYHPDRLCSPGFAEPASWFQSAIKAEQTLNEFNLRYGSEASRLGWLLDRSETLGSSIIEDVQPSLRRVARAEAVLRLGVIPNDRKAVGVIGNIEANHLAMNIADRGKPLTVDDLLAIHETLMLRTTTPDIAGKLRDSWVYIGGVLGGYPPPAYVPPPAEMVPELLQDLCEYVNSSEHHPVTVAAIAHTQFENIHPFFDGNGRTGRALTQLILRRKGITPGLVCPVSAVLANRREDYFDSLASARYENEPDSEQQGRSFHNAVRLLSETVQTACEHSETLISKAEQSTESWQTTEPALRTVTDHSLRSMPVFSVDEISASQNITTQQARTLINSLITAGIVQPVRGTHKQYGLFETPEMLDLFKSIQPPTHTTEQDTLTAEVLQKIGVGVPSDWLQALRPPCQHVGTRSKKRCVLRTGHAGDHRYQ